MKKQHPLKFFIEFVELKPLEACEEEFYEGAIQEYQSPESRRQGYIIDLKVNSDGGESEFKLYFKDVLANKFLEQKSLAIQAIENELMGMVDMNSLKVKLAVLLASTTSLIDKMNAYRETARFPFLSETFNQLRDELDTKARQLGFGAKPASKQPDKSDSVIKLQWLGQLNILGTLFYDLRKGQDGGSPYLSGSVEDVKRVVIKNFIDSEGNDLSKATLDTIFMPSRSEKRANIGDRIELPNKKPKK